MVRPVYKSYWDIPGGYVEPGESPRDACTRELVEELGLHLRVDDLLVVDWAPDSDDGDKLLFIFDGGQLTAEQHAAIRLQESELAEYRYVDPTDLDRFTIPRLARRLRAAIDAVSRGRCVYLETDSVIANDRTVRR